MEINENKHFERYIFFLVAASLSLISQIYVFTYLQRKKKSEKSQIFRLNPDAFTLGNYIMFSDSILWFFQIIILSVLIANKEIFYEHDIYSCYSFRFIFSLVFLFNDLMMTSTIYFHLKQHLEESIIRIPWPKLWRIVVCFLLVFLCFLTPLMLVFDKSRDENGNCYVFSITLNRVYVIVTMVFISITLLLNIILMVRVRRAIIDGVSQNKDFRNMMILFGYQLFAYILIFVKVFFNIDDDFYIDIINLVFPLRGCFNARYFFSLVPSNNQNEDKVENELQNQLLF